MGCLRGLRSQRFDFLGDYREPGAFPISGFDKNGKPITAAALFLFATEDGTILDWNSNVFTSVKRLPPL
jgi:hypothetical protein